MSLPPEVSHALEATWPAAALHRADGWLIREGAGGGKRVSCATREAEGATVEAMEAAQAALGQPPLVMLREGEAALDAELAARGYEVVDPVVIYAGPVDRIASDLPPLAVFPLWPPLAVQRDIWAEGGIGDARLAVMARAAAKMTLLARVQDRPAGTAFVGAEGHWAAVHALEVAASQRRRGAARVLMTAAANWAQAEGATGLCLAVTERNAGARALYASLGMEVVGSYHYRMKGA